MVAKAAREAVVAKAAREAVVAKASWTSKRFVTSALHKVPAGTPLYMHEAGPVPWRHAAVVPDPTGRRTVEVSYHGGSRLRAHADELGTEPRTLGDPQALVGMWADIPGPPCCNPAHLSESDHSSNLSEAWERGRRNPPGLLAGFEDRAKGLPEE